MSTSKLKIVKFGIDWQCDFMGYLNGSKLSFPTFDNKNFEASLAVNGGVEDGLRLKTWLMTNDTRIDRIVATLDSHQTTNVSLKAWWEDENGHLVKDYTIIDNKGIKEGRFVPRIRSSRQRMLDYTQKLEDQGNYPLMVWPDHCIIGTPGHNIFPPVMEAFENWCVKNRSTITYLTKGSNPYTEHYGALQAEVPDPNDPSTQLNMVFIQALRDYDIIVISGQASSHCVKSTIQQIVDNIGDSHLSKIHLLTDCMSPVAQPPGGPDFPKIADDFLKQMEARGLRLVKSTEFMV